MEEDGRIRRIAVVGMGRSGTSILAEFLARSGVYFDEGSLPTKGKKQRKFEHARAREIDDAILADCFGAREHPPYGRLPRDEIVVGEEWRGKVDDFVRYMDGVAADDGGRRYWGFKDPRATILHSLWLDHFDVVVAIFRNPLHVVDSYLAKGWIPGPRKRRTALGYWTRFNRSVLTIHDCYSETKPVYVLDFNADVPAQLASLCDRLALPRTDEAFALYRADGKSNRLGPVDRLRLAGEAGKTYEELKLRRNLL